MTRWSLFAPVIVTELLGPLASLKRSNELVRGNFELVFLTAAFAVVLEEAVAAAGTLGGLELTGSETWGQWLGGSVATIVILPVASFATALVYGHLRRVEDSHRSRSGRPLRPPSPELDHGTHLVAPGGIGEGFRSTPIGPCERSRLRWGCGSCGSGLV